MDTNSNISKRPDGVFPAYGEIPNALGTITVGDKKFFLFRPARGFYHLQNFHYGINCPTASTEAIQWQKDEWKVHASLMRPQNPQDPNSVHEAEQNIANAWELAAPIAAKYGIEGLKIIDMEHLGPGFLGAPEQSKKNIVFYYGKHDSAEMWRNMLSEIENAWRKKGVRTGQAIEGDMAVSGSDYFHASRGKKDGCRLTVAFRDSAALAGGPFENISVSPAGPPTATSENPGYKKRRPGRAF